MAHIQLQANLADAERHAAEEGSASANELIMPENRLSKQYVFSRSACEAGGVVQANSKSLPAVSW